MKKCYINPQIVAYRIHTRSLMEDTSKFGGGGDQPEEEEFGAKGFYGSWEFDDDDE